MSAVQIVLVAALVIFMIGRRFVGQPVGAKTMILPLGLTIYGLVNLNGSRHGRFSATDLALLGVELFVGLLAGVGRGATIKLYLRDGHLWQRYTALTLVIWIAFIGVRIGFTAAGHALGANLPATGALLATFGISILVESLIVGKRAADSGAPILATQPRGADRRSGSRRGGGRLTGVR